MNSTSSSLLEVISFEDRWAEVRETVSSSKCAKTTSRGVTGRNGRARAWSRLRFCRTYSHRPCAERKVRKLLRRAEASLAGFDDLYFSRCSVAEFSSPRLSDRLYEKRSSAGDGYWWVERIDGWVWIVTSVPLTGRTPPTEFRPVTAETALGLVQMGLILPGVRRSQFSKSWPDRGLQELVTPGEQEGVGQGGVDFCFGDADEKTFGEFLAAAADRAERTFGKRPIFHEDEWQDLNGLSDGQWEDCLEKEKAVWHRFG